MAYSDSSFARLVQAWEVIATGRVVSRVTRGVQEFARRAGLTVTAEPDAVLWLRVEGEPDPPRAASSIRGDRRNFRIVRTSALAGADVHADLRRLRPRLVVADVTWCDQAGAATVKRLHRHWPATSWLLCWDEASPRWLETLLNSGARGAVLRDASDVELARAFSAVLTDELWFSRRVVGWIHAALTTQREASEQSAPLEPWPTAANSSGLFDHESELTHREAEVLLLVRQGFTNKEVAVRLDISINTVKKHLASAFAKRGLRSRRQTLL